MATPGTRTPVDCRCPQARHVHGTQLAYVRDRCRCTPCRTTNAATERARTKAKAYGRYDGLVDAEPVRAYIRQLSASGVGLKRIHDLSGVSAGVLSKLMYGQPLPDGGRRGPSARCTPKTRDRILSVPASLADGSLIPAVGTQRRLQALVVLGWSQCKLSKRLGIGRANFGKTLRHERVTVATERAVRELYEQLWDTKPPRTEHRDKIAYSRARRHAADQGWLPPLAWDDETIDDPAALPMLGEHADDLDEIAVERIMAGTLRVPMHSQSPERREAIRRLAARGYADRQIGERLGLSTAGVGYTRSRHNIPSGVACSRAAS